MATRRARRRVQEYRSTRSPGRPLGFLGHDRGRGREPLAVKGRQHDVAGSTVVVAVGGEQAVAEQRDQVAHPAVAPAEVGGVGDRDVVVCLRAEGEHDRRVEQADREHGPEALVAAQQQLQRLALELARPAHAEPELAGRPGASGGALGAHVRPDAVDYARRHGGRRRHAHRIPS
jgi:hypothetical protein